MTRRFAPLVAAAGMAMAWSPALACQPNQEMEMKNRETFQGGYYAEIVRDVKKMRNAARLLDQYGEEDACESVMAAAQEILNNPAEAKSKSRPQTSDSATQAAKRSDNNPDRDAQKKTVQNKRMSATPISSFDGRIRADNIIGSDVIGPNDEVVAEIEDIIFDSGGKPAFVLVSHGGLLGIGEDVVVVPFSQLMVSSDRIAYFIPMTEKQLEAAPKFKRGRFDLIEDENWRKQLDDFYRNLGADKQSKKKS